MAKLINTADYIGKTYHSLTVISFAKNNKYGHRTVNALCKCGSIKKYTLHDLTRESRATKTCGCEEINDLIKRSTKHGLFYHPLRNVWNCMIQRCYNSNNPSYVNYGARNIKVCDEWRNNFMSFYNWSIANGWQKGLSIDRKNNDKGYEPDNCHFITRKEQNRNTRANKLITYKGETKCFNEWCEELNLNINTIHSRFRYGWSVERAFTTKSH